MLKETTIPAESLCIEITETAVISNLSRAKRFVAELRDIGCRIALDDFGCGLSSFSYLKQFPVDYIKIDGSFIKQVVDDQTDRAIVQAINHVAHTSNIETVAECVEDDGLLDPLRELGSRLRSRFRHRTAETSLRSPGGHRSLLTLVDTLT